MASSESHPQDAARGGAVTPRLLPLEGVTMLQHRGAGADTIRRATHTPPSSRLPPAAHRMSLAAPADAPAPVYPYSAPNEAEVRLAIARQVGSAALEAVWESACAAVGARRGGATLTRAELGPIAAWLSRQEGTLRLVGRSLDLRLRTFDLLSATASVTPRGASRP